MSSWVTWQKKIRNIKILITFPLNSNITYNGHSVCVGHLCLKDTMIFQLQDLILVLSLNWRYKYGNMVFEKENLDGINWLTEVLAGVRYLHVLVSNQECKIIHNTAFTEDSGFESNIQVPSRLNVIVQVSQVQPTNAGHTMTDVSTACAQVIIRVKVNFASLAHS